MDDTTGRKTFAYKHLQSELQGRWRAANQQSRQSTQKRRPSDCIPFIHRRLLLTLGLSIFTIPLKQAFSSQLPAQSRASWSGSTGCVTDFYLTRIMMLDSFWRFFWTGVPSPSCGSKVVGAAATLHGKRWLRATEMLF
jgi:hypothetical protein